MLDKTRKRKVHLLVNSPNLVLQMGIEIMEISEIANIIGGL